MTTHTTDILIVGAGPTGLFAAYYAGFRGLSVTVLDSLPELGGQITAMYPEKQIHDVAGFPSVKGRDLVTGLVDQADTAEPTYLLEQAAATLEPGEDEVVVGLEDGTRIAAGAVLVTAGIGRFEPRPLPAGTDWIGRGLEFFVPSFEPYADKDVVIVGGGDSAFDWAVQLEPVARSVTLVHRRERFRAHEATVNELRASPAQIITSAQVAEFHGTEQLTSVTIAQGEESFDLPCDAVVAALGFIADLGPLQEWGMEVHNRHIVVDSAMRTSVHRVFAAGDITDYEGKVRLIAVGFGEAATAVNNAAVVLDPGAKVFPGHSSDGA